MSHYSVMFCQLFTTALSNKFVQFYKLQNTSFDICMVWHVPSCHLKATIANKICDLRANDNMKRTDVILLHFKLIVKCVIYILWEIKLHLLLLNHSYLMDSCKEKVPLHRNYLKIPQIRSLYTNPPV